MSKYIKIYEQLFPTDPISASDPRRSDIIQEMRFVHRAKTPQDATKAVDWWFWDSPDECLRWVRRARKLMAVE